ncbi:MAG: YbaK/EbsC family protein [Nibricoccus sp.]
MPAKKLKQFLDDCGVKYISIQHSPAYTASVVAKSAHISGNDFGKTVIVKIEDEMAMVVLPAHRKIVLSELRDLLGSDSVELASEDEFIDRFPDCELGAMPPFGNLYGMRVYLEHTLTRYPEIAFNAGTHREVIKMPMMDYLHYAEPIVLDFATV